MAITPSDFSKIWASNADTPEYTFTEANYLKGWDFVGNLPPTRAQWNAIQKRTDEKMKYVFDNFGAPLVANTVADMTEQNRVYVYTGSETGYTAGHWYYWNGSAWTDGGVYNSNTVQVDPTLTISGAAADAKVTGDRIGTLDNQMLEVADVTGLTFDETLNLTLTDNYSVSGVNGTRAASTTTSMTYDYVPLDGEKYDRIRIAMMCVQATGVVYGIAFYSERLQTSFIGGYYVKRGQTADTFEINEYPIPEGTKYFRTTWYKSDSPLYNNFSCEYIITGATQSLTEMDVTGQISDGYVKPSDGTFTKSSFYSRTNYIPVVDGVDYYYNGCLNSGCCVAGYDDDGAYLGAVLLPGSGTLYNNEKLTIPSTVKYIMASNLKSGGTLKVVAKGDVVEMLKNISQKLTDNLMTIAPQDYTTVALFERVGVCGDSFASGAIYNIPGAVGGAHYGISWVKIMGRMNGINCVPYANPGANTESFLTNARCLPALLSDTPCNLYVLNLGINPDTTLGTLADIHDADYTQNPNTFYGNYGRIYEQIIAHAPNSKIVFAKPVQANADRMTAVQDIADHYSVPCIDPSTDLFFHTYTYLNVRGQGHPVGVTYAGMAKAFERLIAKCMVDNIEYFKNYTGND